ncbi:hypothetical protein PWT90_08828 [Aphanocladium album]|nr:hypothetical protein PWT90_08828 [Aphanocladium album]
MSQRSCTHADRRMFAELSAEVFADQVEMDYTDLLGGEPFTTSGVKQAASWKAQLSGYASTQHGIIGILVNLQKPNETDSAPTIATAVANITATLVSTDGKIVKNGGRLHLGLQRILAGSGEASWRISSLRAVKGWMEGDFETSALVQQSE